MLRLVPIIFNGSVGEVIGGSLFSIYEFRSSVSARILSWARVSLAGVLARSSQRRLTCLYSARVLRRFPFLSAASSSMGMFEVSWFIALFVRALHREALNLPYHWEVGQDSVGVLSFRGRAVLVSW